MGAAIKYSFVGIHELRHYFSLLTLTNVTKLTQSVPPKTISLITLSQSFPGKSVLADLAFAIKS